MFDVTVDPLLDVTVDPLLDVTVDPLLDVTVGPLLDVTVDPLLDVTVDHSFSKGLLSMTTKVLLLLWLCLLFNVTDHIIIQIVHFVDSVAFSFSLIPYQASTAE